MVEENAALPVEAQAKSRKSARENNLLALLHFLWHPVRDFYHPVPIPKLKPQEIPLDDPDSRNMFQPTAEKPFVATPAAIDLYSHEVIVACWAVLRELADEHNGLDYLQVFEDAEKAESLWFIEDGAGGAVTALLPSDY